jgi:hypothetical protein
VPPLTPVTTPVPASTVAIDGRLLPHSPPGTVLVSVIDSPIHTLPGPAMTDGAGLTVTTIVERQEPIE